MNFVRFEASDGVELQGWLSKQDGDWAALHIHGMCGNGYENRFIDTLREVYTQLGISFFSIDTRGRGVISEFRKGDSTIRGGSCYEIFEESSYDIEGALEYLRSIGKTKFILQGHSLGGSKVVNYIAQDKPSDVCAAILLAPTDMVAWASTDPNHTEQLERAQSYIAAGTPEALVDFECWPLDKTPLSAQSYTSKSQVGRPVDIYGGENETVIGSVQTPMLIVYGTNDIGITAPFGTVEAYKNRLEKIRNANTKLSIIENATHSFKGYEPQLSTVLQDFLKTVL